MAHLERLTHVQALCACTWEQGPMGVLSHNAARCGTFLIFPQNCLSTARISRRCFKMVPVSSWWLMGGYHSFSAIFLHCVYITCTL